MIVAPTWLSIGGASLGRYLEACSEPTRFLPSLIFACRMCAQSTQSISLQKFQNGNRVSEVATVSSIIYALVHPQPH
jgi:hypothetical protein